MRGKIAEATEIDSRHSPWVRSRGPGCLGHRPIRWPSLHPAQRFATYFGTDDGDFIDGPANTRRTYYGRGGDDIILGQDCGDSLNGESGRESLHGAHGNDSVRGQANWDGFTTFLPPFSTYDTEVVGGEGTDNIQGGPGSDEVYDQGGSGDTDKAYGDDGDDRLNTIDDDGLDEIFAGTGSDHCDSDAGDDESSCES